MLAATLLSIIVVLLCVLVHNEIFRFSSRYTPEGIMIERRHVLFLMSAALAAHIVEIWLYALVLLVMERSLGLGHITGDFGGTLWDYVYFSAVSYTSLGLGDVWPHGPIRFLTGIEALNGLIMIGWTIAFTYPVVRDACRSERKRP